MSDRDIEAAKQILSYRVAYFDFWKSMYRRIKRNAKLKIVRGDITITLISDLKLENQSFKRVFHVQTADKWYSYLVVHDSVVRGYDEQIHVRLLHCDELSEYPKKPYPQKVNLEFWRKRKFVVDYIDKYQFTKLGGIYGDIRDKGYIVSFKRTTYKELDKCYARNDIFHLHHYTNPFNKFTDLLQTVEHGCKGLNAIGKVSA